MSTWTTKAGDNAIWYGWRVRAIASGYPAPRLPLTSALAAAKGKPFPANASTVADVVERYRALAIRSAPLVVRELVAAHDRCPQRTILLAGYAEGATVLRHAVPKLPPQVLETVAGIDLVADPTADPRVDSTLTHMTRPTIGIDTAVARIKSPNGKRYTQNPLQAGAREWCGHNDLVCDAVYGHSFAPHSRYPWAEIGVNATRGLPDLLPSMLVGLETTAVAATPANAIPPTTGVCGPASGFVASSYTGSWTESTPSVGGWLPYPPQGAPGTTNLSAVWYAGQLTYVRSNLWVHSPSSASSAWSNVRLNLLFAPLRLNRPVCAPLATESSPLGPAYPAVVYEEAYGTGRYPRFWGCGYLSVTDSNPATVRYLITAALLPPFKPGPWTCQGGKVVAGAS